MHVEAASHRARRAFARASSWLAACGAIAVLMAVTALQVRAQETVLATTAAPRGPDEQTTPVCKTDLRLSGAVYNSRHPERSFALVQVRANEPAGLVRVGYPLAGFELLAIEPRAILLRNADGECWLRLVGDPAARARASAPSRSARAKPARRQKKSEVVVIGHR